MFIDGRPPSSFPGCFTVARANAIEGKARPWDMGATIRVSFERDPRVEQWVLRVRDVDNAAVSCTFDVIGSVTGYGSAGSTERDFVSNSGRVRIDSRDW